MNMIPIVSIVGKSDSGKTTLIEKLVPELCRRGYRVATVKHDVHGFEVDREGKDSWRHKKAGAHTVEISSPMKVAVIRDVDHDAELNEIRDRYIRDVDVILSEGFKRNRQPKIEVSRREKHRDLLCTKEDNLLAVASDQPFEIIVETAERSGAHVVGPVPLPTKIERFTIRRSAFIDKDSHEHFEIRTHNRLIDVLDPDSKTIDMLVRLNLPAGVDIEIKI